MGSHLDVDSEMKVALALVRELYFNLTKVNVGYYKFKVEKSEFHLRSSHIAHLLRDPNNGDKTYFKNVILECDKGLTQ